MTEDKKLTRTKAHEIREEARWLNSYLALLEEAQRKNREDRCQEYAQSILAIAQSILDKATTHAYTLGIITEDDHYYLSQAGRRQTTNPILEAWLEEHDRTRAKRNSGKK